MRYSEAVDYILSLNDIPHKKYLKNKNDAEIYLQRIGYLLKLLGHPERKIPHYIHITGTSGKGSVAIMLESILRAAGKKTGLTTSPHPSAITERWAISGKEITGRKFAELTKNIQPKIDTYIKNSPYDFPSFFEIVTAVGFVWFAQQKIDWAVVEVGLGGRHDSTNIIPKKDTAVITNIGQDHLKIIGPTLADVTVEKSGIIKTGCGVFTMEKRPELLKIIYKECRGQRAKLHVINNPDFRVEKTDLSGSTFLYKGEKYTIPVLGTHQINNAILAIETAKFLRIPVSAIKLGLTKIKLPVRLEIIHKKPLIILDGAHNPDKMRTTASTVARLLRGAQYAKTTSNSQKKFAKKRGLCLLLGFSADKNITVMLKQLIALAPKIVVCTQSSSNPMRQAADPQILAEKIRKFSPNTKVKIILNADEAFAWAKKITNKNDVLLVTGSFFLSGQIKKIMREKQSRN